jgi:hypothetical protein
MKNKWHDVIRKRLVQYRKECLICLYPKDDYEWGCGNRKNIAKTLSLVNKIVKGIPVEAWPILADNEENEKTYFIASGNWSVRLRWIEKRRTADLKFNKNDHTAWLIEKKNQPGVFVNYDIGGS